MQLSPSTVNILKTEFENQILSEDWLNLLHKGEFYEFEQLLFKSMTSLYDSICETLVNLVSTSDEFINRQKEIAETKGLKKLITREVELQLRTGTKIKYDSLYAKITPEDYKGSRHLSMLHWGANLKSSPLYQSITCLYSVICASFEMSKELLRYQGRVFPL